MHDKQVLSEMQSSIFLKYFYTTTLTENFAIVSAVQMLHFRLNKFIIRFILALMILNFSGCSDPSLNDTQGLQYRLEPAHIQADEIRSKPFKPIGHDLNFGFTPKTLWLRFRVENRTGKPVRKYIGLDYPLIEKAVLYRVDPKQIQKAGVSGMLVKPEDRARWGHNITFEVELKPGSTHEYLMSLESSNVMVVGSFYIQKESDYEHKVYNNQLILGLYYGILLVMLVYNFIVFIFIRDLSFLFYVLYNLGFGAFVASENGLSNTLFFKNYPLAVLTVIAVSGPFFLTFSALFVRSFLRLPEHLDRSGKLLLLSATLTGSLCVLAPFIEYQFIILPGTVIAVILWGPVILYSGFKLALKKHIRAILFTVAWLFFTTGTMIYGLRGLGVLAGEGWSRQAIQAGSAVEMILLSLALGYNMLEMRRKQQLTHERLLTERGRISQDIHDMVGAELTTLLWNLDKTPGSLLTLKQRLRNTLIQVQDTVYLLKLRDNFSDSLISRMQNFLKNIDHIKINFTYTDGILSLGEKEAINIYKIFLEWMSNVLRHSRPTEVTVKLRIINGNCTLCVQDDGKGIQWRFPSETDSTRSDSDRNGLSNIAFRARQIDARLRAFAFKKANVFIVSLRN